MMDLTKSPAQLKASILQDAMMGKLTQQLPEDGDAKDLLAQINAEKDTLIKAKKIKKQKALPEIEDDEIPFEIPDNWQWVRLGDIAIANSGHNLNKHISKDGKVLYSKVSDMNLPGNEKYIMETSNLINTDRYVVPKNSIIFPKIGGAIKTNKRRLIANENTSIDPNTMAITPITNGIVDYLWTYMNNIDLSKMQAGTSMPSINKTKINNLIVPLPPLSEQKRIVEKLDSLLPKVDEFNHSVEQLHNLREELPSRLSRSFLQSAMMGKLTKQLPEDGDASELLEQIKAEKEALVKAKQVKKQKSLPEIAADEIPFEIPDNWRWVRLGDVATFYNGDRGKNYPGKKYWIDSGIPFINAGTLSNGKINEQKINYISEDRFNLLRSGFIELNDILYTLRGSVGKVGLNKIIDKGAIASSLTIIRPVLVDNEFMLSVFLSPLNDIFIKNSKNGSAQPNLSSSKLSTFLFPLPPLSEQKRIVEKLDKLFEELKG